MTSEQLGKLIKRQYPVYDGYDDAVLGRKMLERYPKFKLTDPQAQELVHNRKKWIEAEEARLSNAWSSKTLFWMGLIMVIAGGIGFYNANSFEGYNAFAIWVLSIAGIIWGLFLFSSASDAQTKEHDLAFRKGDYVYELANKHQDFVNRLRNMSFEDAERDHKVAQFHFDQEMMKIQLRNETTVSDEASRHLLTPRTYDAIRLMQAQAEISVERSKQELKLDLEHQQALQELELKAKRTEMEMETKMIELKTLLPFHELKVLNQDLAELSLQLEVAEKLPESNHKRREIERITNQMETWQREITQRQSNERQKEGRYW